MSFSDFLTHETTLTLAAALVGGAWTLFQGTAFYERLQERRAARIVRILEAAAEGTYRAYVRQVKKASRDGKLTSGEARHARELARQKAIQIARRHGINLIRDLGEDFLELALTRAVNRLKHSNG